MEFDKEAQKPVLPKDLFRSDSTWSFYEMFRYRFPWVGSCLCVGTGWIAAKTDFKHEETPVGTILSSML